MAGFSLMIDPFFPLLSIKATSASIGSPHPSKRIIFSEDDMSCALFSNNCQRDHNLPNIPYHLSHTYYYMHHNSLQEAFHPRISLQTQTIWCWYIQRFLSSETSAWFTIDEEDEGLNSSLHFFPGKKHLDCWLMHLIADTLITLNSRHWKCFSSNLHLRGGVRFLAMKMIWTVS